MSSLSFVSVEVLLDLIEYLTRGRCGEGGRELYE